MESFAYIRFLFALLAVLGLIAALAWAARRFGLSPRVTPSRGGDGRRLAIVEVLPIDARRRLLLIRRDNVEHLVMVGESEVVIEHAITKGREVQG